MNLFLLGLTCSEWPAQALRLQNASSRLHYPGACIITTLSATHRPCYPAASQYLHKEPQVLRLRCPVPVFRHHAMSRPLQSQRSRHISCLTASLLPCVFLIGTAHNKLRFAPFPVTCYLHLINLFCVSGRLPTGAVRRPAMPFFISATLSLL